MENSKLLIAVSGIGLIATVALGVMVTKGNGERSAPAVVAKPAPTATALPAPPPPAAAAAPAAPAVTAAPPSPASAAELIKLREELDTKIKEAQEQTKVLNDAVTNNKNAQAQQLAGFTRAQKYANGFIIAQPFKPAAAEYYMSEGKWPESNKALGMADPASFEQGSVRSVGIDATGRISIVYARMGNPAETIWLQGLANPNGHIVWKCVSPDVKDIADVLQNCVYQEK